MFKPALVTLLLLLGDFIMIMYLASFQEADHVTVGRLSLIAFSFSQAILLGMWLGLGKTHLIIRIIGALAGVLGIFLITARSHLEALACFSVIVLFVSSILFIIRRWNISLKRFPDKPPPTATDAFQFSIRQLIYLTIVTAILISIGKIIPQFHNGQSLINLISISICFGALAQLGLWATLGVGSPIWRTPIVIVTAIGVGFLLGYYLPFHHGFPFFPILTTYITFIVGGTLLVFRVLGFRILRVENISTDQDGLSEFEMPEPADRNSNIVTT